VAGLSKCCKYHRTCAGGHPKFYTQHAKRTNPNRIGENKKIGKTAKT
jgi:hypothetical protein